MPSFEDYQQFVQSKDVNYNDVQPRCTVENLNMLHCVMGLSTEANELVDTIKKTIMYGKELNTENLYEEMGDVLWYFTNMCNRMGWTLSELMEANMRKLNKRYQKGFTTAEAVNRDTTAEMEAMAFEVTADPETTSDNSSPEQYILPFED